MTDAGRGDAPARVVLVALTTLVLLGSSAAQQPPPAPALETQPEAELAELGPRVPIGSLRTLETVSTLSFEDSATPRHTLTASYAFADRARLHLTVSLRDETARELRFRHGERVFGLTGGAKHSRELSGAARLEVLRDFELRRALFLWPEGLTWSRAEGRATARLPAGMGQLLVELDDYGRPGSIELAAVEGVASVGFARIVWQKVQERWVPKQLDGLRGGRLVWRERVEDVVFNKVLLDSFFAPPDRRAAAGERDRELYRARDEELQAVHVRRTALAPGLDWPAALARCAEVEQALAAELAPAKLELDPTRTLELDAQLRPAALLSRLRTLPARPPAGFVAVPARSARVMFVRDVAEATASRWEELRAGLPPGARPATPYLRLPRDGARVLLVVPVAPAEPPGG